MRMGLLTVPSHDGYLITGYGKRLQRRPDELLGGAGHSFAGEPRRPAGGRQPERRHARTRRARESRPCLGHRGRPRRLAGRFARQACLHRKAACLPQPPPGRLRVAHSAEVQPVPRVDRSPDQDRRLRLGFSGSAGRRCPARLADFRLSHVRNGIYGGMFVGSRCAQRRGQRRRRRCPRSGTRGGPSAIRYAEAVRFGVDLGRSERDPEACLE